MTASNKTQTGFTIIELMITVAIAGIVLAFGVPSFLSSVKNSRLTTGVNDLVAAIHLARSEATKRGLPVVICRTNEPNVDRPSCGAGATWQDGWMVFADDNNNRQLDDNEEVVQIHTALHKALTIQSSAGIDLSISYQANGFAALAPSTSGRFFVYCDGAAEDKHSRVLVISNSGRPNVIDHNTSHYTVPACS